MLRAALSASCTARRVASIPAVGVVVVNNLLTSGSNVIALASALTNVCVESAADPAPPTYTVNVLPATLSIATDTLYAAL